MSNRIAFIAGSNGPEGPNQLKYALDDQARLSSVLAGRFCGFEVAGTNPTTSVAELRQGIFAAAERCRPGDTLVVGFAGHAILDGGELFLLWNDSHPDRLLQTALPARDVFTALNRSRATSKLLILDCCHAGAVLGGGFRSEPETSLSEVATRASSFLMLLASDRLERAREVDSLSGGFLTVMLCGALRAKADADDDGQTSLTDAVDWVRERAEGYNHSHPDEPVPIPLVVGKERGPVMLTNAPDWEPWTFNLGSVQMAVLPLLYSPFHAVAISKHPITNAQYREFVADAGGSTSDIEPTGYAYDANRMEWDKPFRPWEDSRYRRDDLPVVCVDYRKAQDYCFWLSAQFGGWCPIRKASEGVELADDRDETRAISLPTPSEWSFAASGDFERHSPHDTAKRPMRTLVRVQPEIHQNSEMPAPIDLSGVRTNSFGISDMFGSVWEWCLGFSYYQFNDPDGFSTDARTVELRGGGFLDDATRVVPYIRASELKDGLRTSHTDLGFRISTLVLTRSLPEPVEELVAYYGVGCPRDRHRNPARLQ